MTGTESHSANAPRRRPPVWFVVVVVALVALGVAAPAGVNWVIRHQESTVPPDTSGNRAGSMPADTAPDSTRTRSP